MKLGLKEKLITAFAILLVVIFTTGRVLADDSTADNTPSEAPAAEVQTPATSTQEVSSPVGQDEQADSSDAGASDQNADDSSVQDVAPAPAFHAFVLQSQVQVPTTIYVDSSADAGSADGTQDHPYATIADAVANATTDGDTINLTGSFTGTSHIAISHELTIDGNGSASISTSGTDYVFVVTGAGSTVKGISFTKTDVAGQNMIGVQADNVTVSGNTFAGAYNLGDGGSASRAIEVSAVNGFAITNNQMSHLRQPAYINTANGTVAGNTVTDSKGFVVVADAHVTFSNNSWGTNIGDIAFICAVSGQTPCQTTDNNADIVAISNANNGAVVEDQLLSPAKLSVVYVDANATAGGNGTKGTPYQSVADAVARVIDGGTINVAAGTYDAFSVDGKTNIIISGAGKAATLIQPTTLVASGIAHKYTANMQVSVLVNNSTGITIKNIGIKDNGQAPGAGGPDALLFWNGSTGTITDSALTGTYTINGAQTGQGIAVDAGNGQTTTLTVANTDIRGFQKNGIEAIDGNGATGGQGGTITLTVSGSAITGAGSTDTIAQNGILVWNRGGGTVAGSVDHTTITGFTYAGDDNSAAGILAYGAGTISVHNSTLTDNQIDISTTAGTDNNIDASNNYWGTPSGPTADQIDNDTGTINYTPWYIDAAMTTLNTDPVIGPGQGGGFVSGGGSSGGSVSTAPSTTAPSAPAGQVLGAETFNFTTMLTVNSHGDAVKQLQLRLAADGIQVTADGIFGPKTKAAVKKWQAAHKLTADGIVGPKTRAALNAQ